LLVASVAAREDVIDRTWTTVPAEPIEGLLAHVVGAVPESYPVAVAHRGATASSSPAARLFDRLVTLRYVRQQDHVEAWRAAGLTAASMKVFTPLWLGETPPEEPDAFAQLEAGGLVANGELTGTGRAVREQIETDTNRRAASTWSVLDGGDRDRLIGVLSQMPDSMTLAD
jgi:hypothetical protein